MLGMEIIINHIYALFAGFILDLIIGDPEGMPHPVRFIGNLISRIEGRHRLGEPDDKVLKRRGVLLVIETCTVTTIVTALIMLMAYTIHPMVGMVAEATLTSMILATKSLRKESMKVYMALKTGSVKDARAAVSMIVGRDTADLDEEGVTKAAVETVAENTSDGVIAPMIALIIGGPVLGMLYKAINTMDSMVGYKNDKYIDYGRAAAKLDDAVNFLPSRISAYLMIISCMYLPGQFNMSEALRIYRRDRFNHSSPNSAQTESVCAGALGIRLAGNAYYFGKLVEKPYIGDDKRPIEAEDIRRANNLMFTGACLCMTAGIIILGACYAWWGYL